jgi:membrane associated rhomboid family serine protease
MSRTPPPETPLVEVGRYPRLADAREYALALAARDLAYVIEREGDSWLLRVEEAVRDSAARELATVAEEEQARQIRAPAAEIPKLRTLPLFLIAWAMGGMFFLQNVMGSGWIEAGASSSARILGNGEWWRAVTALTLHADLAHVLANIATGVLFSASLIPFLGAGVTCLMLVLCGALANVVNAWGYRSEAHASIGASTAVFSALGILVGMELIVRWSHAESRNRWQLVVPIGAGLALLAFLGVGEEDTRIDFMAHWWGFCVGVAAGLVTALLRPKMPHWRHAQGIAGSAALLVLVGCWWMALRAWSG